MKHILMLLIGMLAIGQAKAADFYTAGDSHCVEIARLNSWRSVAVNGVSVSDLPRQLSRIPFGAFVIVCAGTNDAGSQAGVSAATFYAEAALSVADWRGQKLVWIGPSNVRRPKWVAYARFIDSDLEGLMREKRIPYISIFHDPAMQPGSDNVHLRTESYRALSAVARLQLSE